MLTIRPATLRDANAYVEAAHRHNGPVAGCRWAIACHDGDRLCGVAIAGRPVATGLDDGLTIEILRVCTDGTRNACSCLYGACCRIAKAMGYRRAVTYTLQSEPGTSVKASGFAETARIPVRKWDHPSRRRDPKKYPAEPKVRWERLL